MPIVRIPYPPLLEPDGEIMIKAKYILPRHLHAAKDYPSKVNPEPVQQQRNPTSPYDEGLHEFPCINPRVN